MENIVHVVTTADGPGRPLDCFALEQLFSRDQLQQIEESNPRPRPSLHDCGNHFVETPNDPSSLVT